MQLNASTATVVVLRKKLTVMNGTDLGSARAAAGASGSTSGDSSACKGMAS